jgi:hypothetical protein
LQLVLQLRQALSFCVRTQWDARLEESDEVFLKSVAKSVNKGMVSTLRGSLWWLPLLWKIIKWMRKHKQQHDVTRVRIREGEEVAIMRRGRA